MASLAGSLNIHIRRSGDHYRFSITDCVARRRYNGILRVEPGIDPLAELVYRLLDEAYAYLATAIIGKDSPLPTVPLWLARACHESGEQLGDLLPDAALPR